VASTRVCPCVVVGAHVYLFALGGTGGAASKIWKYKLLSHVAADGASSAVDTTAVAVGSPHGMGLHSSTSLSLKPAKHPTTRDKECSR
jgi:hypothetical protein